MTTGELNCPPTLSRIDPDISTNPMRSHNWCMGVAGSNQFVNICNACATKHEPSGAVKHETINSKLRGCLQGDKFFEVQQIWTKNTTQNNCFLDLYRPKSLPPDRLLVS